LKEKKKFKRCTNKHCTRANELLPLKYFPIKKEAKDGRYSWCKKCFVRETRVSRERTQRIYKEASGGKWWLYQYWMYNKPASKKRSK
tara:strand:- start:2100 stop:2360 length:261 start_codon:yes stop_codon:yes gene_type:complete